MAGKQVQHAEIDRSCREAVLRLRSLKGEYSGLIFFAARQILMSKQARKLLAFASSENPRNFG
jgi:hypothetical protein